MDDSKETRKYRKLKREALDRNCGELDLEGPMDLVLRYTT